MVRSGVVKVTRTSSRAGARVAVREAFGSAPRSWSEIERCAEATLSTRSRQAKESEASAGVGASPINAAAHAAAIAPRIILPDLQSVSAEALLSSERPRVQRSYSSRMNFRGLSATPLTRTS